MKPPKPNLSHFSEHPPPPDEAERRAERKARGQQVKRIRPGAPMTAQPAPTNGITTMTWVDEWPTRRRGSQKYDAVKAMLRANPGRVALIGFVRRHSNAHPWRKAGFEAQTSKREDGQIELYASWPERKP